jgi:hypothetical protein
MSITEFARLNPDDTLAFMTIVAVTVDHDNPLLPSLAQQATQSSSH